MIPEISCCPSGATSDFNGYLKEIAAICGINKEAATTHTARHTFATTVTLENDVPIETVSKMLGHPIHQNDSSATLK